MPKHQLSFELQKSGDTVEIHGDLAGLTFLKNVLEKLISHGKQNHVHLMTEEWSGNELSSAKQGETNSLINQVNVHFWKSN